MKLRDFFQNIALGELSGSPYVELGSYELSKSDLPKVIHSLNQALEYFYSNFSLKLSEVTIELQEGMSRYYLDSLYAYSNPEGSIKYIQDSVITPFQDDVLHILAVKDLGGYEYPLNDYTALQQVNTPEYNCLQVNNHVRASHLIVQYQANHPRIPLTEPLDSNYRIQIPSSYRTALQTYTACLLHQNLGGENLNVGNALYAKFKTLIEELKLQGIGTVVQTGSNIKPILRGWL